MKILYDEYKVTANFSTKAAAEKSSVPAGTQVLQTFGYSQSGDGGGAYYVRVNNTGTLESWQFQTNGGTTRWSLATTQEINPCMFGCPRILGTRADVYIQSAIDFCLRNLISYLRILDGQYQIENTLHLGWGNGFYCLSLIGAPSKSYNAAMAGVRMYFTQVDRPMINVQGGRYSKIQGITLVGAGPSVGSTSYIYQHMLDLFNSPDFVIPEDPNEFFDSLETPNAIDTFRPYAAISIDGYTGNRPSPSWPDVNYPAWTGITTQWNKKISIGIEIDNCHIMGFGVGVVTDASGGDGNGDFLKIKSCNFSGCVYCVSVTHTQSRTVVFQDNNYSFSHTCITNRIHGIKNGRLDSKILRDHFSFAYNAIDVAASGANGILTLDGCYAESLTRLGIFATAGSSLQTSILIANCSLHFADSSKVNNSLGRVPDWLLKVIGSAGVVYDNCELLSYGLPTLAGPNPRSLIIRNCRLNCALSWIANFTAKNAAIATVLDDSGVFVPDLALERILQFEGITAVQGLDNVSPFSNIEVFVSPEIRWGFHRSGSNRRGVAHRASEFFWESTTNMRHHIRRSAYLSVSLTNAHWQVPPTITGLQLTGTYLGTRQGSGNFQRRYMMEVGDKIWDNSGKNNLFIITNVSANSSNWDVTAIQVNNLTHTSVDFLEGAPTQQSDTSSLVLFKKSVKVPKSIWYGDFTAGSNNIINISRNDGVGTTISSTDELYVGMPLAENPIARSEGPYLSPVNYNTEISSISPGNPGSATMSKNAIATGRFPILPILIDWQ